MRVAIAYYSRHHGNTKKVLDAIADLADVTLIDAAECKKADLSDYDMIGFASGIYFGRFADEVLDFARANLPAAKPVFLVQTYGVKGNYTSGMRRIIAEKSCRLLGPYGCRGFDTFGFLRLIGGIAKGRPNERDLEGARKFFKRLIEGETSQT
ncbi:MAG: flavodoxin [Firmicutes bacterium]|jgi:flavodoxin|nr:flavodoxin [Bacillota bacterium]